MKTFTTLLLIASSLAGPAIAQSTGHELVPRDSGNANANATTTPLDTSANPGTTASLNPSTVVPEEATTETNADGVTGEKNSGPVVDGSGTPPGGLTAANADITSGENPDALSGNPPTDRSTPDDVSGLSSDVPVTPPDAGTSSAVSGDAGGLSEPDPEHGGSGSGGHKSSASSIQFPVSIAVAALLCSMFAFGMN